MATRKAPAAVEAAKTLSPTAKRLMAGKTTKSVDALLGSTAPPWKESVAVPKKGAALPKTPAAVARRMKAAAVPDTAETDAPYKWPEGWKEPKNVGAAVDAMFKLTAERLAVSKKVAAIEVEEKAFKHWIITTLPKTNQTGAQGKLCRVSLTKKDVPRVDDWGLFYKGIVDAYSKAKKKGAGQEDAAFALLGRSVSAATVREIWDAGEKVQGVGTFTVNSLSVNKL